jgi:hypothetical protein
MYKKAFMRLSWIDMKWASSCFISSSWISSLGGGSKSSFATYAAKLSCWVNLSVAVSIACKESHEKHCHLSAIKEYITVLHSIYALNHDHNP